MFKKYFLPIICLFTLIKCGYLRIPKDEFGEPNINENVKYNFVEMPTKDDFNKIDTTAYYIQVFEGRYYNETEKQNPKILIFHNDGFFKDGILSSFEKNDIHRTKNSIYYGGKYRIKENIVELEKFLPSTGGRTNYYVRNVSKGKIEGNKIIFDDKNSSFTVFVKRQKLN